MTTINYLSNEMLIEIFSHIHVQERQRLVTVCSRWELVIESMWRNINKLIMKIGAERSSYGNWEGATWANILCRNDFDAVIVLEKFNGSLTNLDLEFDLNAINPLAEEPRNILHLILEIENNTQLNSVRIGSPDYDNFIDIPFLECIPTENLQHLSLYLPEYEDLPDFQDAFKSLMEAARLKYLCLKTYLPWMQKILEKIDTLESLHIGDDMEAYDEVGIERRPIDPSRLPHLREFSVLNMYLTCNNFFHNLETNQHSLCALELRGPFDTGEHSTISRCIVTLRNLTYLSLILEDEVNIQILSELPQLEQLYINFKNVLEPPYDGISEVKNLLVKLPNIKQCWFYNDEIHEALTSGNFLNEAKLEEPEELSWTAWKRVFGIPINSSE